MENALVSNVPVLSCDKFTCDSAEIIRRTNCSAGISRLNMRTGRLVSFSPPNCAIFTANAVLPIEGRAAMIVKLPFWKPPVYESKSLKPEGNPVVFVSVFLKFSSTFEMTGGMISLIRRNSDELLLCAASKINFSASSMISFVSLPVSYDIEIILFPASIKRRLTARSLTISA